MSDSGSQSRNLIELPDRFVHSTSYRVVYSDINAANHLGADRMLPIALEGQFSFVRSLGYEDAIVFENAGLIMVQSMTDYLSEVRYGAVLTIDVAPSLPSPKTIELIYSIRDQSSGIEVARVKTRLLFYDYEEKRVVAVPDGFKARLEALDQRAG